MPIYNYKCNDCAHTFEELIKGSEKPKCPACGSAKLEKLLSAFAVGSSSSGGCAGGACDLAPSCPSGGCCQGGSCGI